MIKKFVTLIAITTLLFACTNAEKKQNADATNGDGTEMVQGEIPTILLKDFEARAGEYIDKEIYMVGIVDHICKHGGKKLFLANDDADVHVEADTRFDESLAGSEIKVKGIVREFRVDESYCLKMEEDNIQSHKKGDTDKDLYERKIEEIAYYRDSMKVAGVDYLSYYSIDYVSHEEIK